MADKAGINRRDFLKMAGLTGAALPAINVIGNASGFEYLSSREAYGGFVVRRATGDNPLVDIEYLDRALLLHRERGADLTVFPLLPYGTGIEVLRGDVLKSLDNLATDPFEREHITQYIYRHEGDFHIVRGTPDKTMCRPDVRLTVDTEFDYQRMQDIYAHLYQGLPIKVEEVLAYMEQADQ